MKIQFLFPILFVLLAFNAKAKDLFLIDQIETIIFGPEETAIVTKSDIDRPGLDGVPKTKDKVILQHLIFQDAKKYKIVDEKMVDRYMAAVQAEHNLTVDQLKDMFNAYGYTYQEGREQLSILYTVNSLIDFKVRSRLIIPEKEVKAYYDANPLLTEAKYNLQRMFIPVSADVDKKVLKEKIIQKIDTGQDILFGQWGNVFPVKKANLSEDKLFITNMKVGQTYHPQEYQNGFEIFKLVDKKDKQLVPFEERYKEIADELRRPLYEKLFQEYTSGLFENCTIVHVN